MNSNKPSDLKNEHALDGVNVLDLSEGIAGPFAARLLGDFGADVIKIEKCDGGDPQRYIGPLVKKAREGEQSLLFQYLNWNKRSISLDLSDSSKLNIFKALLERSNIVIESFIPGQLNEWGIGVEKLLEWNPKLVVVSITNFGQTGPYAKFKANDLILQAMSGMMQISGSVDREPLRQGLSQTYYCAGLNAAYAALAAYLSAERDGVGEHVDVSILECLASELVYNQPFYTFLGAIQGRRASVQDPFDGEPIPARKGYVSVQAGGGAPFYKFADLLNLPELSDPKYSTPKLRTTRSAELHKMLATRFSEMDPHVIFEEAAKNRLLMGVVQSAKDLLGCPHLESRDFYTNIEHPETGEFRFPAELAKLSRSKTRINSRAPMFNEHEQEILQLIGL
ncbi:MAG: hypothetical protein RJB15_238 [Pseudomonadota bacterium]